MLSINFSLKDPADILPWGKEPDTNIHWFGLTDGHYWLSLGNKNLYEYTHEVMATWKTGSTPYPDYNIVRFLEDFTELFSSITESLPENFYRLARSHDSLYAFLGKSQAWLDRLPDEEDVDLDAYLDKYQKATRWVYDRTLTSGHLKYGPRISFFRCGETISIVWDSNDQNEEGIAVWTAGDGQMEMPYRLFVEEVKNWGDRFFTAMEAQINKAFRRDWGTAKIDTDRIKDEQEERKEEFRLSTSHFLSAPAKTTEWPLVMDLIGGF